MHLLAEPSHGPSTAVLPQVRPYRRLHACPFAYQLRLLNRSNAYSARFESGARLRGIRLGVYDVQ